MRGVALIAALGCATAFAQASATSETTPIPSGPTAANDTALWVHPTDVSQSLVFGTDGVGGGLRSYRLNGQQHAVLPVGLTRAVDVRYGVTLDAGSIDVVLSVASDGAFRLYAPALDGGALTPVDAAATLTGLNADSAALYFNRAAGALEIFVGDFGGQLKHYRAASNASGKLTTTLLRTLDLGAAVEGLVADDFSGRLFLTLANRGLFTLSAEQTGAVVPVLVDSNDGGRLAGATGVALYFTPGGGGYVIASATASSRFSVYSLSAGHAFVSSFNLVADAGRKGATNTRGIEAMPMSLGPPFEKGLFIAHDPNNFTGPNYKLFKWDEIAGAANPALAVDPSFDPRPRATLDAGQPDAGGGSGGGGGSTGAGGVTGWGGAGEEPKGGCNCASAGLLFPLLGLGWLLRGRRKDYR